MKTSARNQFSGKVKAIYAGTTNDEIVVDIGQDLEVIATITRGSTKRLGLAVSKEVIALIKAPWIILADASDDYEFSTCNNFASEITAIIKGSVNSEIYLKTQGNMELVSIVTNESVANLQLEVGKKVKALFKAPHVILATKKASV